MSIKTNFFIGSFLLVMLGSLSTRGLEMSLNMPDHDSKAYYFCLSFGFNFSQLRFDYDESFIHTDTFKIIQPHWSPGFNLGLMGNLRLNKRIDLRIVPSLSFAGKRLVYSKIGAGDSLEDKIIESVYIHFPLQIKFKSDR